MEQRLCSGFTRLCLLLFYGMSFFTVGLSQQMETNPEVLVGRSIGALTKGIAYYQGLESKGRVRSEELLGLRIASGLSQQMETNPEVLVGRSIGALTKGIAYYQGLESKGRVRSEELLGLRIASDDTALSNMADCVDSQEFLKQIDTIKEQAKTQKSGINVFITDEFYSKAQDYLKEKAKGNERRISNQMTKTEIEAIKRKKWTLNAKNEVVSSGGKPVLCRSQLGIL
ncbi:predicted protein [Nematostella vectensis]|uniref:Uncharacterized protein n=1 Tax=Nematostella vectensis TaxID=45351 RepID=A7RZS1_NEMVE|nr:predicted protein [Nematostella vectensis]|eukprot:XP_001635057.1 predicted protein [Nematostella vectensis]